MLKNKKAPSERRPIAPDGTIQIRERYGVQEEILVEYTSDIRIVRGDPFFEKEVVEVFFNFKGMCTSITYSVENRRYDKIDTGQATGIPESILEILADALPTKVRRILPGLRD